MFIKRYFTGSNLSAGAVIFSVLMLFCPGCGLFDDNPTDTTHTGDNLPAGLSKEMALNLYNTEFSSKSAFTWTGNQQNCTEGTVPAEVLEKVASRLNFYRKITGISSNITFNTPLNLKAQKAALMMLANNTLSHTPPDTWKCYSAEGAAAAQLGNLILRTVAQVSPEEYIDKWVEDEGDNNKSVLHRKLILMDNPNPVFGFGATDKTACMTIDITNFNTSGYNYFTYIAYPPAGCIVDALVYKRWSFMVTNGDLSAATVQMKDAEGKPYATNKLTHDSMVKNLVWEPDLPALTADKKYIVEIAGVKYGEETRKFSYEVTLVKR